MFLIKSIKNFREIKKKLNFILLLKKSPMSARSETNLEKKKIACFHHSDAWNAFCNKHKIKPGTYARDPGYYSTYGGRNCDYRISEAQYLLLIEEWDKAYAENSGWRGYLNTLKPIAE